MTKFKNIIFYIFNNPKGCLLKLLFRLGRIIPDKVYLSLLWRLEAGYWLDWKNPKTFCEKIQWLKLYNRQPNYTQMVDKYAVKDYVAKLIGNEYVIPTLGVWDKPEEIDWDILPDKFVLKTTHGGGSSGVVICKDKNSFDRNFACKCIASSLKSDIYRYYREWPYKAVKKRIIAELFLEESSSSEESEISDYKFFCFNGTPLYCQVIRDRRTNETIDFYDMEWNHLPFVGLNPFVTNGLTDVKKPEKLNTMIDICKKLSDNIPFSRIDLYVVNDNVYFGEITFFPASGLGTFTPEQYNEILGNQINICQTGQFANQQTTRI